MSKKNLSDIVKNHGFKSVREFSEMVGLSVHKLQNRFENQDETLFLSIAFLSILLDPRENFGVNLRFFRRMNYEGPVIIKTKQGASISAVHSDNNFFDAFNNIIDENNISLVSIYEQ